MTEDISETKNDSDVYTPNVLKTSYSRFLPMDDIVVRNRSNTYSGIEKAKTVDSPEIELKEKNGSCTTKRRRLSLGKRKSISRVDDLNKSDNVESPIKDAKFVSIVFSDHESSSVLLISERTVRNILTKSLFARGLEIKDYIAKDSNGKLLDLDKTVGEQNVTNQIILEKIEKGNEVKSPSSEKIKDIDSIEKPKRRRMSSLRPKGKSEKEIIRPSPKKKFTVEKNFIFPLESNNPDGPSNEITNNQKRDKIEVIDQDSKEILRIFNEIPQIKSRFETLTSHLTKSQLNEFKECFSIVDRKGMGYFQREDLKEVLAWIDKFPSDDEIDSFFLEVDKKKTGKVTYEEFLTMLVQQIKAEDDEDYVKSLFQVFDPDNKGEIDPEELKNVFTSFGEVWKEEEFNQILKKVKKKENGKIDFDEFVNLLCS